MSHSPTPWKIGNIIDGGAFVRVDNGGPPIAIFQGSDNPALTREMAIENAEFAVKAVNTHDQIAALVQSAEDDDEKLMAFETIKELLFPSEPIDLEREEL